MKPTPRIHQETFSYPDRRQFLKCIGAVAGIGLAATAFAGDKKDDSGKNDEKDAVKPEELLRKKISVLAGKLADDDFKVRQKATKDLIAIGKGEGKDAKQDAVAEALVLAKMEEVKKLSKDPEALERAKKIVVALTPKPKAVPPHEIPGAAGGIRIAPRPQR